MKDPGGEDTPLLSRTSGFESTVSTLPNPPAGGLAISFDNIDFAAEVGWKNCHKG